ncbi:MAG: 5-oxoprolinase subunit PxpA [Hyphomicrobiaceae bacterium]|nr:5-oxoprolinase subunit PxpA [Hyphomicrobiaceae bacterium]
MKSIDLNADLGEGFGVWRMGDDEAMMSIVSSANIACGFHAGDPLVMSRTVELALSHNVAIGAHPGYDDLRGFGRTPQPWVAPNQLAADLQYQIGALRAIARANGTKVRYIKLHGALANLASTTDLWAKICVEAIVGTAPSLPLLVMGDCHMEQQAQRLGLPTFSEFYADRAYDNEGQLLPRNQQGAVILDPNIAADRVLRLLETGVVSTAHGAELQMKPHSICVHGDHPTAVQMAQTIRDRLEKAGVKIEKFAL